jgi:hypothetical protein
MRNAFILTLPLTRNFGGALQAFALGKVLQRLSLNVVLINKMWNTKNSLKKTIVKKIGLLPIVLFFANAQKYYFFSFMQKHFHISKPCFDDTDLKQLNFSENDVLVYGSDQIWNPLISPGILSYFGSFARSKTNIIQIAYAASFGNQKPIFKKQLVIKIKKLLKRFQLVSVRESKGCDLAQKFFNINPKIVLDPTLLLGAEGFLEFVKKRNCKEYCLKFFLQDSQCKSLIFKSITTKFGLEHKEYVQSSHLTLFSKLKSLPISVPQFLNKIYNCSILVTDSYHGMLFAILFQKTFFILPTKRIGSCLSRIHTVLSLFKLEKQLIMDPSEANGINKISIQKWRRAEKILKRRQGIDFKLLISSTNVGSSSVPSFEKVSVL